MAGEGLALTERDTRLLAEVRRFGVLTREHCLRLGWFRSRTRANARLKRLCDAGYLSARRHAVVFGGPLLVYLPGRLAEAHGARHRWQRASAPFVAHQLGVVDIRIAFERATAVQRWTSDRELAPLKLGVVPDGYVEYDVAARQYGAFLEYDRGTEPLARVTAKVRAYLDLAFSGRFETTFHRRFFRLAVVTDTVGRLTTVSQAVSAVTTQVVRLTTVADLNAHGPLAPIWRRPGGRVLEPLTS